MKGDLYLCGAGNVEGVRLALTVQKAEARWERLVLLDDAPDKLGESVMGLTIAGPLSMLKDADAERDQVVNLVTRKTASRWAVMEKIEAYGIPFATLIHPSVDVFGTTLADGVTVYQDAVLGAGCSLETGSVVLVRALVGHGSHVGKGCVIAPGAVINARVTLEERVYFGTNATILPDLRVGADATVGALSSVLQEVPARATAIGVPATILVMGTASTAPETSVEADPEFVQEVCDVWKEILGARAIRPTDNFFKLGGTSLQVFNLCGKIEEHFGVKISPAEIYRFLTVESLASHLSKPTASAPPSNGDRHAKRREFFAGRRKRRT